MSSSLLVADFDDLEAEALGEAAGERVEVEVAVGDVEGDHSVVVAEVAEVELDGLDGDEVGGDRVAAEGVDDEHVVALGRLALEAEAGVAEGDGGLAGAVAQVGEEGGVAGGEGDDLGVDLIKTDPIAGERVGGDGAGA
jgi:hypothetical protein